MNINISAPINHTGYGVASLNIIKQLATKTKIAYFPIGNPSVNDEEEYNLISSLINNSRDCKVDAPFLKIWHQFDLLNRIGRGKYYALPFFELDKLNELEKKHMTVPDILLVSSNWAKNVIVSNNIQTPIEVVPLGVDLSIFDQSLYQKEQLDDYVFLNIGKWEIRKGHDILYSLFKQAFPNEKDVKLILLASTTTNSYSSKEEVQQWKRLYSADNITVIDGVSSHVDVAQLMSQSDCGIFPSRAEGWNLELLEMMAMNKPVIATNYSSHTEFCNSDNAYLVEITETEPAYDGKAFNGQGNWAKISQDQKDQIIEHMRYLYKNRINSNKNGINTAKKFSWENTASKILGVFNQ
jgi:glycosyltransferase involved in cell wall biosynthesis